MRHRTWVVLTFALVAAPALSRAQLMIPDSGTGDRVMLFNAFDGEVVFKIPPRVKTGSWSVVPDTETGPGSDEGRKGLKADQQITLAPRSLIVLM